ncbi:24763_t:CDS:2 [Gigaspora margarita]|uniref:24763_t:CDS:1 n=1 Tax=Gigaspora margarita TaxID=4874 RepID=A0ABN7UL56_GIGMA|nr:24763_t:CDS:2 [Gigaspora margarita]
MSIVVLGEKCKERSFYANLYQAQIDKESIDILVESILLASNTLIENTNCNFNDYNKENILFVFLAISPFQFLNNETANANIVNDSVNESINEIVNKSANESKNLIKEDNPVFNKSVCKFIKAYKKCCLIHDMHIHPAIASFFQTCD